MNSAYAIDINAGNFAPAQIGSISTVLNVLIPLIMLGAALILLIMLLMGGFKMLTAGGNAENVQKSQQLLVWSIAGFVMIALSYFATKLIAFITNVPIPL